MTVRGFYSRFTPILAAAVVSTTCGEIAAPTPSGRFRLSGFVTRANRIPVVGATVTALDGADAGRGAVTGSSGEFVFHSLPSGTYRLHAAADAHTSASRTISVTTADTSIDFVLLKADLALEGLASYEALDASNDMWAFHGVGLNRGDACAVNVAGQLSRLDEEGEVLEGQTRPFTLPESSVVPPSEKFQFTGCCFKRAEVEGPPFVAAHFTFQSIVCP